MRLTRRGDRGIVKLEMRIMNQDGRVVQEGTSDLMVRCRESAEGTPAS